MMNRSTYVLILIVGLFGGCNNGNKHNTHSISATEQQVYTCPMHPQIIRNEPGNCPICGMKLVQKMGGGSAIKNDTLTILLKPSNEFVISKVKTVNPQFIDVPVEIEASGKISYDTRNINTVSARVSGRIEKLYVRYRYQLVSKGQKLMDIYSKELLTEQENYLYLLNNDADNQSILIAAETRLLLLGLSSEQVNAIKHQKKAFQFVSVYSPYSGHLHDLPGSTGNGNMSAMSESPSQEFAIKEGMYVAKGQSIFNILNTGTVWAILNIYPDQSRMLKTGQRVFLFLNAQNSVSIEGRIDFIDPFITGGQNTTVARVYLSNRDNVLKIGSILTAKITVDRKRGIFIPSSAIINLGNRSVVFVRMNNIFRSRLVLVGLKSEQSTEIISGISDEDNIAENAQLLMDSESFIKTEDPKNE